ncbi:hypothetical protein C1H46_012938 [Malus baccata]|uniref:Uncharacterized protein n=1 Tax=Malus baccata TaxID=106549 RepID=A0A540MRR1_MALBA|nr:hypothetical protein C1H46_012938 [Malus baccata]
MGLLDPMMKLLLAPPTPLLKVLTLETTKPTWRAGRVFYKLTTSFGECGACQLVDRPMSKFFDVALGARLTSASCDCGRERNTSRPLELSNLKTRLLFLRSSISNSAFNVPNVITCNTSLRREG